MSADNRVCIMEWKGCGEPSWWVWQGSMSAGYHTPPSNCDRFRTEQEAMDAAHKLATRIEEAGYLEYGTQHITVGEQAATLRAEIEWLSSRLANLDLHGDQFADRNPE